jgi:TonB family protein
LKKKISALPAILFFCLLAQPISAQTDPGAAGSYEARKLNAQAVALYKEGKYQEAINQQKQALAIWEKELGKEHKLIATGSTNLAEMFRAIQRYGEAAAAYQRALKIEEKLLGPEHPDLVSLLIRLGWTRHGLSQAGEAEALFKRAVSVREKQGIDHVGVAEPLLSLAAFYQKNGRPAISLPIYQRVIALQEKHFGPDAEPLAATLQQYSCAMDQDKNQAKADEIRKRALLIEGKSRPDYTVAEGGVLQGYATHKEQPSYPSAAKAERLSGVVFIQVEIDETGKVTNAKILCGADLLAAPSREAALKWRFRPTTLSGQPVKVMGVLTFNFVLQ